MEFLFIYISQENNNMTTPTCNDLTKDAPLIKFKMTWSEMTTEEDGFGEEVDRYFSERSVFIYAKNEDEAFDIWEKNYQNEGNNGCDECVAVIEHALLDQQIHFVMPTGDTYILPVSKVLEWHADQHSADYNHDSNSAMVQYTLPFFSENRDALAAFTKSLSWDWISKNSRIQRIPPNAEMMQSFFADRAVLDIQHSLFTSRNLAQMSRAGLVDMFEQAFNEMNLDQNTQSKAKEALALMHAALPMLLSLKHAKMLDLDVDMQHFDHAELEYYTYQQYEKGQYHNIDTVAVDQAEFKKYLAEAYKVQSREDFTQIQPQIDELTQLIMLAAKHMKNKIK